MEREPVRTRLAICLASAAAALALLPLPASAQVLPPYEIATSIRSMGLMPVSQPVRKGQRYVLLAVDRRGNEVKVSADAFTGRILFVEPQGNGRRPVYAERNYPPVYPEETAPPRGTDQRGYQRQAPPNPGEPSVIYAPREGAGANSNPAYRPPSPAKPPSRVATKPPAKPVASADSEASAKPSALPEQAPASTEGTSAAGPPASTVEQNPAVTAPPVQGLE